VTLRRAVNDRPRDPKLRRDLIIALRLRGWTEAARDEALRALAICGENADLHRLLGELYLELGQPSEAVQEIEKAIQLEPHSAQHRLSLGDALFAQGKLAESEAAYVAARDAEPSSPLPHFRIARLRAQALRFPDAAAELKAARETSGGSTEGPYADAYAAILTTLDAALEDIAGRLTALRRDALTEKITREEAHKSAMDARETAAGIGKYLGDVEPPVAYQTVHALYEQAAALTAQSCSMFANFLETRDDASDREANLLRQEASRQLAEARQARPKAAR